jgi:glycogen(starch) synthase
MLQARARAQRRALRRARLIISPSERFARLLAEDYGVSTAVTRLVANPIDLNRFSPTDDQRSPDAPIRLLFVGMLSVRKGIEMIVELSHRLTDEAGAVTLDVAGGPRGWSDYSALLDALQPDLARPLGWIEPDSLPALYRSADVLLVPSHYEPFGIAVGEALACGVPVVVSDAVGAAEWVSGSACRTFAAGDMDSFEAAVRRVIADVRSHREQLRDAARSAAASFDPATVGRRLAAVLEEVAVAGSRTSHPDHPPEAMGSVPER